MVFASLRSGKERERTHTSGFTGGDGGEVCVATVGAKLHKSVCSFLVTDC